MTYHNDPNHDLMMSRDRDPLKGITNISLAIPDDFYTKYSDNGILQQEIIHMLARRIVDNIYEKVLHSIDIDSIVEELQKDIGEHNLQDGYVYWLKLHEAKKKKKKK